ICEKVISENDITIIEGAGGMYVPVFGNYMIADLILELSCPTILVTRPDLGTINHTMLSIEYAKIKNINMLGIVVNNFPAPPDYTSIDNLATFKTLFNLNILGLIPRLKNIDVENGNIDDICIHPESFFVESLGGSFNYEEFLKNILNPN
ncbi:MAG: AAA family ATPase, partial [Candidatus Dadabacteria bacterium]|nr:AAA family ATPase [Candidatus Dadabacteria bacterium]NIQ13886.1 AAA family ATPase [Candidatus Dadabacteria bacterium]